MVTSGNLGGIVVWNVRDVASISTLGTIFPMFIAAMTVGLLYLNQSLCGICKAAITGPYCLLSIVL